MIWVVRKSFCLYAMLRMHSSTDSFFGWFRNTHAGEQLIDLQERTRAGSELYNFVFVDKTVFIISSHILEGLDKHARNAWLQR